MASSRSGGGSGGRAGERLRAERRRAGPRPAARAACSRSSWGSGASSSSFSASTSSRSSPFSESTTRWRSMRITVALPSFTSSCTRSTRCLRVSLSSIAAQESCGLGEATVPSRSSGSWVASQVFVDLFAGRAGASSEALKRLRSRIIWRSLQLRPAARLRRRGRGAFCGRRREQRREDGVRRVRDEEAAERQERGVREPAQVSTHDSWKAPLAACPRDIASIPRRRGRSTGSVAIPRS